mgnify:CR=1 FL=1
MSGGQGSLAEAVLAALVARGRRLVTVESCTGGMVAAALTDIAGSSAVFERGFVTYSNEAKAELVGVDPALIRAHGAVSAEVAKAMAEGGLRHSRAEVAVAITGVAGPGGSEHKPEGLVYFHAAMEGGAFEARRREFGPIGRAEVRRRSVEEALSMVLALDAAG